MSLTDVCQLDPQARSIGNFCRSTTTRVNARCLGAPNFLCYGNACSMLLDRYRAFHQISFFFHLYFLFLLSSIFWSTEVRVDDPFFLVVCSKQAHFFWGRAL